MKMLGAVFILASMVAPSSAFYPYRIPVADQPSTIPSPGLTSRLTRVKRTNQFNIVHANQPSAPNSAGVDQDGHDISYMLQIQFGANKQSMELLMDTAAVNTWIMSSSCSSQACGVHNTFGPSDSSSLKVFRNPIVCFV
jgi:hypothetical protein